MPGLVRLALPVLALVFQAAFQGTWGITVFDLQPGTRFQLGQRDLSPFAVQLHQQHIGIAGVDASSIWDAQGKVFILQLSQGQSNHHFNPSHSLQTALARSQLKQSWERIRYHHASCIFSGCLHRIYPGA
jgi:hypothetical protein